MRKSRQAPDWEKLHRMLMTVYSMHGLERRAAVLKNFDRRKETICRRLGVVCQADVSRIASTLKAAGAKIGAARS